MKPMSFIIVGSGWRSLFFARIAKQFPELFELKYMLCRTEEKARRMTEEYGIPATTSEEVCDAAKPDMVIVSIRVPHSFVEIKKWSAKGYPILTETPAGGSVEDLKDMWELVCAGAKIQVAEQYHRYPFVAAGLKAIKEGKIGEPHMVSLSLAHNHHGASLIRRMLQPDEPMKLRLESVCGISMGHEVEQTDSRDGAVRDGSIKEYDRTVCFMKFAGGKSALYDFSGLQYHSYIRARHLSVRGVNGEWNDTMLRYTGANHIPAEEKVLAYLNPAYEAFETDALKEQSLVWNPFISMDIGQDEYAVASMMWDMKEYIAGGKEVYPMAEALEDAYVSMLMQQAAKQPGVVLKAECMPWQ